MVLHNEAQPKPFDPALGISPNLESLVHKALEKNPANRYQSMEELREALLDVAQENKTKPGNNQGTGSKKTLVLTALAAILLIGGGLAGNALMSQHQAEKAAPVLNAPITIRITRKNRNAHTNTN